MRKSLVISAVNLVEGGTLTVLREFVSAAKTNLSEEWDIFVLVHSTSLVIVPGVKLIEYPKIKRSWLRRLWFEYFECMSVSRALKPDLWVALHDITPRVEAKRQVVYCHNPSPFFPISFLESILEPKHAVFRTLYSLVYRINIRRNSAVIVQQSWLRDEFRRRYKPNSVVVAYPVAETVDDLFVGRVHQGSIFFYPALARPFKNLEVVCKAVRLLEARDEWRGEVRLTIDGSENAYARRIVGQFRKCRSIKFIGLQSVDMMSAQYRDAHCLLFASRKETWGLPLTEAKAHGLAILAADLPYAHETIGTYSAVRFFDVDDAEDLANKMLAFQEGKLSFIDHRSATPEVPFAPNWRGLMRLLTEGL